MQSSPEVLASLGTGDMTEMQRIARDSFTAAVRLCEAVGVAVVPGPTHVTLYAAQRRRRNRYAPVAVVTLPQIPISGG